MRSVGFAPVKGMRHLDLDHVDLDEQGAVGDRAYCLVDVERLRVLRTVQHPSLMGIVAQSYDDGLALTLPTGERTDGPATAQRQDDHLRLLGPPRRPRADRRPTR